MPKPSQVSPEVAAAAEEAARAEVARLQAARLAILDERKQIADRIAAGEALQTPSLFSRQWELEQLQAWVDRAHTNAEGQVLAASRLRAQNTFIADLQAGRVLSEAAAV